MVCVAVLVAAVVIGCDEAGDQQAVSVGPAPSALDNAPDGLGQLPPPPGPPGIPGSPGGLGATPGASGGQPTIERGPDGRGIFPEEIAVNLMNALVAQDINATQQATMAIMSVGDLRMVVPLIDAMRGAQTGIAPPQAAPGYIFALQMITQQTDIAPTWLEWTMWLSEQDIAQPPGYVAWKGRLFSRIDPKIGAFFGGDVAEGFRVQEIVWGGVKFEGIPALDSPKTIAAAEATYLTDDEPVFGVVAGGAARAYPQRLLDWHEMANDTLGGVPVSLAYCTLCGAPIAYDGRVTIDGSPRTLTFGSSGLLYRSNKLMYDRETNTLWDQFTGKPVLGPLVGKDVQLNLLPLVVTTFGDWKASHSDTTVLSADTGFDRDYTLGASYGAYFASPGVMFPVTRPPDTLAPKARVFVLRHSGEARAYPVALAVEQKVITDTLGGEPITIVAPSPAIEVKGKDLRSGNAVTFNAGAAVRAFAGKVDGLKVSANANELIDAAGNTWRITDEALIGPDGKKLPRVAGHLAYWFAVGSHDADVTLYTPAE